MLYSITKCKGCGSRGSLTRRSLAISLTPHWTVWNEHRAGNAPIIPGRTLSERQSRDLGALASLPSLQPLASHLADNQDAWCEVLDQNEAERFLPVDGWSAEDVSAERKAFLALAVVHALRPDRTMAAAAEYVERVFSTDSGGEEGPDAQVGLPWGEALDLEASVQEGPGPEAPILLCSEAGHDASWQVRWRSRMRFV